jgi:hypothetical protein
MDEIFIETSEAVIAAELASKISSCSKLAFSDSVRTPEQYLRTDCEECGNDLPEFRMQRGLLKCYECQSALERRQSQVRRNQYNYED